MLISQNKEIDVKRSLCILLAIFMLTGALGMSGCEKDEQPVMDEPPVDIIDPEPDIEPEDSPEPEEPTDDGLTKEELEAMQVKHDLENYNYIIGTQAFDPGYQFTDQSPLMELTDRIVAWGSNMIKFHATDDNVVDEILEKHDFDYVFM